jgi:hypothetical protein
VSIPDADPDVSVSRPHRLSSDLVLRLRALADDCDLVCRRRSVSPFVLDAAPRLDDWVAMQTPMGIQLMGRVIDHPLLGNCATMTSPVWIADPHDRWVRTLSRFYRLGPPAGPTDIRHVVTSVMGASGMDGENGAEDGS